MARERHYGVTHRDERDAFCAWLYAMGFKFEKWAWIGCWNFDVMATDEQDEKICAFKNALPHLLMEIEDVEFEVA